MADIFDYGDDQLETGSVNSDSGLAQLSELVSQLAQQGIEVERAEAHLKKMKEDFTGLAQQRIPDLMTELGCATITTQTGLKVTVKRHVRASINDKTRDRSVQWFKDQNLERMVNNEFALKLKKGEEAKAGELRQAIEALGLEYKNKKNVHHSTLSAFVKERDAAGESVPDDLFNVYRFSEAKIG